MKGQLTAEKFQHMVWRNLMVRAAIAQQFEGDTTMFPDGRLEVSFFVYSAEVDTDGNKVVLEIDYSYLVPSNNFADGLEPVIRDIWGSSSRDRNRNFRKILDGWKHDLGYPEWLAPQARVGVIDIPDNDTVLVDSGHGHLLQHYARLQIALAAIIKAGHPYQHYLCGTVYGIQRLIDEFNRQQEFRQGMAFYTPHWHRSIP